MFDIIQKKTEGQALETYVKDRIFLECEEIYKITLSLCDAINSLENKNFSLRYRDLKPSNIIIIENSNITLTNFNSLEVGKCTDKNHSLYTRENRYDFLKEHILWQFKIENNLWNIGMIMYFMATGRLPITGLEPIKDCNYANNVDCSLKRIIQKCFETDIKNQYVSVEELNREIIIELLSNSNYKNSINLSSFNNDSYRFNENSRVTRVNRNKVKNKYNSLSMGIDATLGFLQGILKKVKTPILE